MIGLNQGIGLKIDRFNYVDLYANDFRIWYYFGDKYGAQQRSLRYCTLTLLRRLSQLIRDFDPAVSLQIQAEL